LLSETSPDHIEFRAGLSQSYAVIQAGDDIEVFRTAYRGRIAAEIEGGIRNTVSR